MKALIATLLLALSVPVFGSSNTAVFGTETADKYKNTEVPASATVVLRQQLGSGAQGYIGLERATHMGDGIYHAPQYLAGHPTAGTIWPRVITVGCDVINQMWVCDSYDWAPSMGRGEYIYIKPVAKVKPEPHVIVVPGPERVILQEVPVKAPRQ